MEDFRHFSFEEELQRAKWFKEDLEKGEWNEVHYSPGVSQYWMKTFPDEEVPIKALFTMQIPVPADKVAEILDPSNVDYQKKWNRAFAETEIVKTYPEQDGGGRLLYTTVKLSWPFNDRSYLAFYKSSKDVDWYGQKALISIQKDAWHDSKPPGTDGIVRATIGGNFTLIIPDEKNPTAACTIFALRNNNYNGCLPKTGIQFILARRLPATFNLWREGIIDAYNKFFS